MPATKPGKPWDPHGEKPVHLERHEPWGGRVEPEISEVREVPSRDGVRGQLEPGHAGFYMG